MHRRSKAITRRRFVSLGSAGLAAGMLPAWAGAAPPSAPRRGGTVVAVLAGDPPSLNRGITTDNDALMVGAGVFSALLWTDREFRPHGDLAEFWTISRDGLTYTFRLRPNITWHDGTPFSAEDVRYTITEILARYHPVSKGPLTNFLAGVDTPDPSTVIVHLKRPYAPLLGLLTNYGAPILPKHVYAGTDIVKNPANLKPIGTGPFAFQTWQRGDHITLTRNAHYYIAGQPYLDQLIFKIIPDVNGRTAALQAGDVDYLYSYYWPLEQYRVLAQHKSLRFIRNADYPKPDLLIFNVRHQPLADRRVRQAIARAVDRQTLLERAFSGLGDVGHSSINRGITWASDPHVDDATLYRYDPKAAATLLDEAGFRKTGGRRFSLRLVYDSGRPDFQAVGQIMRQQLAGVGVDVQLVAVQRAVMLDQVFIKLNFDMTLQTYQTLGDPALGVQRTYVCADIRPAVFVNASGYCNPEVDKLFAQAAGLTSPAARAVPYAKVQEILARDIPSLVLHEAAVIDVVRTRVHGLGTCIQAWSWWGPVWVSG
jgi:peptide/nickel transport system substrate-binding protein